MRLSDGRVVDTMVACWQRAGRTDQAQLPHHFPRFALFRPMSVTDCLSSANDLLAAHASLISRVRTSQKYHRRQLAALSSPPQSLLKLDLLPSPPPSPSTSPPGSPLLQPKQRVVRQDLPLAKKARVAKYQNYIPEEETIRNDYSQRYVDGGEWPQNWVLGADPARRFEE